jgi:DNA-binding transcriptional regulator YhcF (GntR family)
MSFDALAWAAKQKPGNLAAKMVLLALANYAGETGLAYPSTAAIAEFGDMNPKTATAALDRLEALGLIEDTQKRVGSTKQIKVYKLNLETTPKTEASQKRKPSVSSGKGTQKRVTDTVREPVSEAKASSLRERIVKSWNDGPAAKGAQMSRGFDDALSKALTTRLKDHSEEDVFLAIAGIAASPHHCGQNDRKWRAHLGWILESPRNFRKALEMAPHDKPASLKPPDEQIADIRKTIATLTRLGRNDDELAPWKQKLAKLEAA